MWKKLILTAFFILSAFCRASHAQCNTGCAYSQLYRHPWPDYIILSLLRISVHGHIVVSDKVFAGEVPSMRLKCKQKLFTFLIEILQCNSYLKMKRKFKFSFISKLNIQPCDFGPILGSFKYKFHRCHFLKILTYEGQSWIL